MAKSTAAATTTPIHNDDDLEIGQGSSRTDIVLDDTAGSAASSATPNDTPSKPATPRRSLDFVDRAPHPRSFAARACSSAAGRLPAPLARWSRIAVSWIRGPDAPVSHRISPLFERVQTLPARLVARLPKAVRFCLFAAVFVLWVVVFGVLISDFSLPANVAGLGAPVKLGCTAQLW